MRKMVEIIFIYKWSFSEVESHLKVIDLMGYQPGLEILRYHSPIVTHRFQEGKDLVTHGVGIGVLCK